jgi:DNA-binding NtrC family response regulator
MNASPDRPPRILIAEDQPDLVHALRLLLKGEGYQVDSANAPAGAIAAVQVHDFDVALVDLNYSRDTTSGEEGLELVSQLQRIDSSLPVVVMTAWGSVESAVEAMRRGARDYIEKPWENARLLTSLRNQVELGRALRRSSTLETENRLLQKEGMPELIARSRVMQPVLHLLDRVGPSDANVLITGEHGTGKEVVARWLHAMSLRKHRQFIPLNAGGLSEGVFESELFGHVRGAFTDARTDRAGAFEVADGGTLFLDEIGNMPVRQQAKLLRVLQTGEIQRVGSTRSRTVDVRVISATNADVGTEISEGRFRADLLYRLNTVEIQLPPLRARREDIPLLATHFLRRQAQRYRKQLSGFEPDAHQALLDYRWPGNVRELEHTVERAVLLASGDRISAADLNLSGRSAELPTLDEMTLEEVEQTMIRKALAREDGNVTRAAAVLGLSRSALYRRIQQYGL